MEIREGIYVRVDHTYCICRVYVETKICECDVEHELMWISDLELCVLKSFLSWMVRGVTCGSAMQETKLFNRDTCHATCATPTNKCVSTWICLYTDAENTQTRTDMHLICSLTISAQGPQTPFPVRTGSHVLLSMRCEHRCLPPVTDTNSPIHGESSG